MGKALVMNELNKGIYDKLTGGTALVALLAGSTSVYNIQAPDSATLPYVVFSHWSGGVEPTMPGNMINKNMFIRGYTKKSAAAAGSIDTAIGALLDGSSISVSGYTNFWLKKEQEFENVDNLANGEKVWMCGHEWKVRID
jgi:hypothetical protein